MAQQANNQKTGFETTVEYTELTVPQGSSIKLSVVEKQPAALTSALSEWFKQHKVIRRAFMVSAIEDNDGEESTILMIALEFTEGSEDIDSIIHQAGTLACEYLAAEESIDFCLVNEKEAGISHFITQHVAPFYQRRLGGFIRDAIPIINT